MLLLDVYFTFAIKRFTVIVLFYAAALNFLIDARPIPALPPGMNISETFLFVFIFLCLFKIVVLHTFFLVYFERYPFMMRQIEKIISKIKVYFIPEKKFKKY